MNEINKSDLCGKCNHPFDEHMVITDDEHLMNPSMEFMGYIRCPVENCNCLMTWSVGNDLT